MNKKSLLALSAFFICVTAMAQIEKGKVLASGSVGFSSSKYKEKFNGNTDYENSTTRLWLIPKAGYFITDAIAVGAGLNLMTGTTKFEDDDNYTSTSISFSPFVRYYLPQGLFGYIELGPGTEIEKSSSDSKDKFKSFLWSLGVGYAYFLNDNVAVEPIISYTSTTYTDSENSDIKDKYGALQLQIGFSIYLDFLKKSAP